MDWPHRWGLGEAAGATWPTVRQRVVILGGSMEKWMAFGGGCGAGVANWKADAAIAVLLLYRIQASCCGF